MKLLNALSATDINDKINLQHIDVDPDMLLNLIVSLCALGLAGFLICKALIKSSKAHRQAHKAAVSQLKNIV